MDSKQWHEYVDVIYYINLDIREDRKEEFLEEMRRMGVPLNKIVRFSAIHKPAGKGIWGAGISHSTVVKMFIESNLDRCIIFEDDFQFTQDLSTINSMFQTVFNNLSGFDVIMLSANEIHTSDTKCPHLKRVQNAQTTSGYILNRRFSHKLYENYENGINLLEKCYERGDPIHYFCIDIYWKKLQPHSEWFLFSPKIGLQRPSFSDIEQRYTDYKV
jgi:glycosyl transferase family 25